MGDEARLQRLWDRLLATGLPSKLHGHKRATLERALAGADAQNLASFREIFASYCSDAPEPIKTDNDMIFGRSALALLERGGFWWKGAREGQPDRLGVTRDREWRISALEFVVTQFQTTALLLAAKTVSQADNVPVHDPVPASRQSADAGAHEAVSGKDQEHSNKLALALAGLHRLHAHRTPNLATGAEGIKATMLVRHMCAIAQDVQARQRGPSQASVGGAADGAQAHRPALVDSASLQPHHRRVLEELSQALADDYAMRKDLLLTRARATQHCFTLSASLQGSGKCKVKIQDGDAHGEDIERRHALARIESEFERLQAQVCGVQAHSVEALLNVDEGTVLASPDTLTPNPRNPGRDPLP
jgi:hypothetical protein